jgi:uncharacterized protein (TIGR02421 family)
MLQRYRERIRELSSRLVETQRPIRILDAIKWDESISSFFLRTGFKQIPACGPEYYARVPLRFDPADKLRQLEDLRRAIPARLGRRDPVGRILLRNCRQFEDVVHMLKARGKPQFYHYSRRLYGSTKDNLGDSRTTLRDLSFVLEEILGSIDKTCLGTDYPKLVPAEDVVDELNRRLSGYFHRPTVRAKLDDGIVSDAAAGGEYIKIKRGALFSTRDIDILEVHEGWVHVGTTLNGRSQPWARWLAKGPPCVAAVQEGLATLLEVFAFVSHPARVRRHGRRRGQHPGSARLLSPTRLRAPGGPVPSPANLPWRPVGGRLPIHQGHQLLQRVRDHLQLSAQRNPFRPPRANPFPVCREDRPGGYSCVVRFA